MTTPEPSNFAAVTESLKQVASSNIELAKAELTPAAKHAAIGGGMFGGAGVFALHALWMLLIAGALAVGLFFARFTALGQWASFVLGFVTVAVLSLIVAGILALLGKGQFAQVKKPEATIAELQATIADLQRALGKTPTAPELTVTVDEVVAEVTA